jgi:hypothetical protein
MNLTNLGGGDKHIVFDAIWASVRDSLWSSITVPVFDSAWHIIRIHVGNTVIFIPMMKTMILMIGRTPYENNA